MGPKCFALLLVVSGCNGLSSLASKQASGTCRKKPTKVVTVDYLGPNSAPSKDAQVFYVVCWALPSPGLQVTYSVSKAGGESQLRQTGQAFTQTPSGECMHPS